MTRAEWFLARGRGKWVKARKGFLCEFRGRFGPCLHQVLPGEAFLKTDLAKYPSAPPLTHEWHMVLRYCQHCANQELSKE